MKLTQKSEARRTMPSRSPGQPPNEYDPAGGWAGERDGTDLSATRLLNLQQAYVADKRKGYARHAVWLVKMARGIGVSDFPSRRKREGVWGSGVRATVFLSDFMVQARRLRTSRVVRAFPRDRHVMHVAFLEACIGDLHKFGAPRHIGDGRGAHIAHGGA